MTTTWDELKFYGQLARNLLTRPYDLHKVPGPPGYWGLGHITAIMRPDYHVQILDWANRYGGVYKFSLGCQWVVVISDPAIAAQVLGRGPLSVPRKCVGYQFFDLATNHLGRRSFFTTTDEVHWAAVRKAIAPAFTMANIRRCFPHVLKHAIRVTDALAASSATAAPAGPAEGAALANPDSLPDQQPCPFPGTDIQEDLELALLSIFVEGLLELPADDMFPGREVAAAMNLVLEEANERLKVPLRGLTTYLTRPKFYRKVHGAQRLLGEVYGRLVDAIRAKGPPPESNTTLWACLARMRDPTTGQVLGREALLPELGALLMAGFDTSSHTVAWCLFVLATHPDVQHRVHTEMQQAGLLGPGGLRLLALEHLSALPYLNCVIDECMRMFPVAATASVREVVAPTKVGPYTIPRGVIVWPMLYALHNATHNWEDPACFKPERWAAKHFPGVGGVQAGGASQLPRAFLPFSDGMKKCLGQALGLMEVRTLLVALLSRFSFSLHPSMGGADQVVKSSIMSLTLKMKGGLQLVAQPLVTGPDPCVTGAVSWALRDLGPLGSSTAAAAWPDLAPEPDQDVPGMVLAPPQAFHKRSPALRPHRRDVASDDAPMEALRLAQAAKAQHMQAARVVEGGWAPRMWLAAVKDRVRWARDKGEDTEARAAEQAVMGKEPEEKDL